MNPADELAAKIEPANQSAGAVTGDVLRMFDERFRASLKDLQRTSDEPTSVADLHSLVAGIDHQLDRESSARGAIYNRLVAIENEVKRRRSRGFVRYLVAICIGAAATLAWQSYGEAAKQIIATRAPELGWSLESKQMIASWIQEFGWTKPQAGPESTAVGPSVPETPQPVPVAQATPDNVAPGTPAAPTIDPEQVRQITLDLTALRQTVEQIAVAEQQMAGEITKLQGADREMLAKIPSPPAPAGHTRKPIAPRTPMPSHP